MNDKKEGHASDRRGRSVDILNKHATLIVDDIPHETSESTSNDSIFIC